MKISEKQSRQIVESAYTVTNDSYINEVIGRQILEFTKLILMQMKDVKSLYLLGGYGRGEGSVLKGTEGITPLGDYEFLVVSRLLHMPPRISGIENLQARFHVQYHVEVDRIWKPILRILEKRIYWYEAKFGGKLLFGDKDGLKSIQISSGSDIDLREGFSLIFNRLAGLEKVFNPFLSETDLDEEQKRHLIFQSIKAILACGDSLLLLYGKYNFSYKERCKIFLEESEHKLAEFLEEDSTFKSDYEKATYFKLMPSFDMYDSPLKTWVTAKNHVLKTLTFFLNKMFERRQIFDKLATIETFPEFFIKESRFDLVDFAKFNINAVMSQGISRNIFHIRKSYSDIARVSSYFLASSVKTENEIDNIYLEKALITIGKIMPISKKVLVEENLCTKWQMTRDIIMDAWSLIRR